jgi:hypothetical protein
MTARMCLSSRALVKWLILHCSTPGASLEHHRDRAMTTFAKLVGFRSQSHAPLLAHIAGRLGVAVRRAAAGRYAEQRERIVRTGGAGMI